MMIVIIAQVDQSVGANRFLIPQNGIIEKLFAVAQLATDS
jgi:hypothetical protein